MPSRIEREIEEILTKLDEFVPEEKRSRRLGRRVRSFLGGVGDRLRHLTRGLTGGHVLLGAAILLVVAMLVRPAFPEIARWMTYGGLAIIFGAILLSIRPIRRRRRRAYWRGEVVDLRRPTVPTRLRMWWRRRNR